MRTAKLGSQRRTTRSLPCSQASALLVSNLPTAAKIKGASEHRWETASSSCHAHPRPSPCKGPPTSSTPGLPAVHTWAGIQKQDLSHHHLIRFQRGERPSAGPPEGARLCPRPPWIHLHPGISGDHTSPHSTRRHLWGGPSLPRLSHHDRGRGTCRASPVITCPLWEKRVRPELSQ